jgi:hypothetical protein
MDKTTGQMDVTDWLMEGDPAIRWQVMRDLLDEPPAQWQREQRRVAKEGWGRRLLGLRDPRGTWGGGLYTPKWISTNYTLLLLRDMGLPRDNLAGSAGAGLLLGRMEPDAFRRRIATLDTCIVAMYLSLAVYFDVRDVRVESLLEQALADQMDDGGWNCARRRHNVHHSSLHTTANVLDGLADYVQYRHDRSGRIAAAMARAREFMLAHRLFRSDKTGQVIHEAFTKFSFPPRWRYDVLRALDHFRRVNALRDERLAEAIQMLRDRRGKDGRWKLENHHHGQEFFHLERQGQPSRWNTLRALRVLRWWG